MKKGKMRSLLLLVLVAALCLVSLSGCGKKDASSYVKAYLDANYKGEYGDYAKMKGISEDEAKEELTANLKEEVSVAFSGLGASEESVNQFISLYQDVYKIAKYEVKGYEEMEDGTFEVTVTCEGADVFTRVNAYLEETVKQYFIEGKDLSDVSIMVDIMVEALQNNCKDVAYGDPVDVTVRVTKQDGTYSINDEDLNAITAALYPQS